jgi:hypothetical protein
MLSVRMPTIVYTIRMIWAGRVGQSVIFEFL